MLFPSEFRSCGGVPAAPLPPPMAGCPSLLQAAERCGTLQQEVEILRHAAAMPADERQRQREQRAAEGPPADLMRQLGAVAAANRRQQLAEGVFRPSHALPTMSVEQFGELEYKR